MSVQSYRLASYTFFLLAGMLSLIRLLSFRVEDRFIVRMETALDREDLPTVFASARRLLTSVQRRSRVEAAVWAALAELAWRKEWGDDALVLCNHVVHHFPLSKVGRFQALCLKTLILIPRGELAEASESLNEAMAIAQRHPMSSIGMAQLRLSQLVLQHRSSGVTLSETDYALLSTSLDTRRRQILGEIQKQ